jgi:hypothetical protein
MLMAMFFKKVSKTGCVLSMIIGAGGFFMLKQESLFMSKEILLFSASFVAYFIGMLIKKEDNPILEQIADIEKREDEKETEKASS